MRSYSNLSLCDGEVDRYQLTLPANEGVLLTLSHPPGADLSLELSGALPLSIRSDHPYGVEKLGVLPSDEGNRNFEVRVLGARGSEIPYTLDLRVPETCPPDGLEGPLGNDSAAQARPIKPFPILIHLCEEDEDWFEMDLPIGGQLFVEAQAEGSVQLSLRDTEGNLLAQAEGSLELDLTSSDLYYLQVTGEAPQEVLLNIQLFASEDGEELACVEAPLLTPEQPLVFPERAALDLFESFCGINHLSDEILRLELLEPSYLRLEVEGRSDVALSLRQDCGGEEICGFPGEDLLLEAGLWFVVLNHAQLGGPLEVQMQTRPSICEEDGDCPEGTLCRLDGCHPICETDEECSGAQSCIDDRCQEPERCLVDEDCLGLRVCELGICSAANCETHSDCEALCSNRLCAPSLPDACEAHSCPRPQVCSERLGLCYLDDLCETDNDCPAGLPFCDGGECMACVIDSDCTGSEECLFGVCRFIGGCEVDNDCPGSRICDFGFCMPSGVCEDDIFSILEDRTRLYHRAYTDLMLCDGQIDEYDLDIPDGQGLSISMRHTAGPEVFLELRERGMTRMRSNEPGPIKHLLLPSNLNLQQPTLSIQGSTGHDIAYDLNLVPISDPCLPDSLEGPYGNDTQGLAQPVTLGELRFELCEGEEDWFRLRLSVGQNFSLSFPSGDGPDLNLLDQSGRVLAEGESEVEIVEEGIYFIRLFGQAGLGRLLLSSEASLDAVAQSCVAAPQLELGIPLVIQPSLRPSVFELSCGVTQGSPKLAYFELPAPTSIDLNVQGSHSNIRVAIRRDCQDADSEIYCQALAEEGVEGLELEAGRYTVLLLEDGENERLSLQLEQSR